MVCHTSRSHFTAHANGFDRHVKKRLCAVLLMRCWALYNDKRILRCVLLSEILEPAIILFILVKVTMDKVIYIANPFPDVFTGCVILLPPTMWMLYVVPLIYDSTMFIMTVSRIYVLSREYGATPLMERLAEK
ncbi:hypothetical protein FRC09_002780 [Ceratobasidium sp. 395]|nr:hypothetical protein FRC09_002780 [Ceratobasidium sp. 395]